MGVSKHRYKNLLSEKRFLRVAERAKQLTGSFLIGIEYDDSEVIFKTRSATVPGRIYYQRIKIEKLAEHQTVEELKKSLDAKKKLLKTQKTALKFKGNLTPVLSTKALDRALRDSTLRIHCTCPAWLFWGYQYYAWKRDYGLVKEIRRPVVRQPIQRGFVCKHLYSALQVYPFISSTVAKRLKQKGIVQSPDKQKEKEEQLNKKKQNERK